jgi:hypothetical protein
MALISQSRIESCCGASCTLVISGTLVLFGLSSCHTVPGTDKTLGWEKHRLPNTPKPYNKLLVEIDAVEGTQPTAGELAELKGWLEQMTNKPGGVTVKLDNLIAPARARGRAPDSLALEYLNGPTDEDTAFIYVLCYRSRLNRYFAEAENPNFTFFPYPCAIFINRSYALVFFSLVGRARKLMMQHELGHALGLARNESHSGGGHCTNKGCLMRAAINFNVTRLIFL